MLDCDTTSSGLGAAVTHYTLITQATPALGRSPSPAIVQPDVLRVVALVLVVAKPVLFLAVPVSACWAIST